MQFSHQGCTKLLPIGGYLLSNLLAAYMFYVYKLAKSV